MENRKALLLLVLLLLWSRSLRCWHAAAAAAAAAGAAAAAKAHPASPNNSSRDSCRRHCIILPCLFLMCRNVPKKATRQISSPLPVFAPSRSHVSYVPHPRHLLLPPQTRQRRCRPTPLAAASSASCLFFRPCRRRQPPFACGGAKWDRSGLARGRVCVRWRSWASDDSQQISQHDGKPSQDAPWIDRLDIQTSEFDRLGIDRSDGTCFILLAGWTDRSTD